MKAANQVTDHLTIEDTVIEEDLSDTYHTTIHTCFNLGFEVRLIILYNNMLALSLCFPIFFSMHNVENLGMGPGNVL